MKFSRNVKNKCKLTLRKFQGYITFELFLPETKGKGKHIDPRPISCGIGFSKHIFSCNLPKIYNEKVYRKG